MAMNKLRKYIKSNKKFMSIMFACELMLIGLVFYGISLHNLDALNNYALFANDLNKANANDKFYDLREIHDCNGVFACLDYKTIYIKSINMQFFAVFLLVGVTMTLLSQKIKRICYQ